MAYIDKKSLLTAYKVLSHNTSSPSSQGATQFISAIRYLFALDRFVLKNRHKAQRKAKFYINKCRSASCMQGGLKQASA